MDLADAFQIVIDLARENAITEHEAKDDPEVLQPLAVKHKEALNIVEDFVVQQFGDD